MGKPTPHRCRFAAPFPQASLAPIVANSGNSAHKSTLSAGEALPPVPKASASDNTHTTQSKMPPTASPDTKTPHAAKREQTAPALAAAHAARRNTHGKISFSGSLPRTMSNDAAINNPIHTRLPVNVPMASAFASGFCPVALFFRLADISPVLSRKHFIMAVTMLCSFFRKIPVFLHRYTLLTISRKTPLYIRRKIGYTIKKRLQFTEGFL